MALVQILSIWAALSGAVFSYPVMAQEEVTKGNSLNPHQPPTWVLHLLAPDPLPRPSDIVFSFPEIAHSIGKPHPKTPKRACRVTDENGNKKWSFCDL